MKTQATPSTIPSIALWCLTAALMALVLSLSACISPMGNQAECEDDSACDDGLPCTVDYCDDGECKAVSTVSDANAAAVGACVVDTDCELLAGPCQTATCVVAGDVCSPDAGTCQFEIEPDCTTCQSNLDCGEVACGAAECVGGECRTAEAECTIDSDCGFDETGCTVASCLQLDESCGGGGVCVSWSDPSCGCQDYRDCDDDDPCTADLCQAGECIHIGEPACLHPCTSPAEVVSLVEAVENGGWFTTEGSIRAAGVVEPVCSSWLPPALTDGGHSLPLYWAGDLGYPTNSGDEPEPSPPTGPPLGEGQPSCQSASCEGGESCTGVVSGVRYLAWGHTTGAADVPAMEVEGFCLSTHPRNIAGRYALEVTQGATQQLIVEIIELGGELWLDGLPTTPALRVEAYPGYIELQDAELPGVAAHHPVRLYANGNSLIGNAYHPFGETGVDGPGGTAIAPPMGTTSFRMTRL